MKHDNAGSFGRSSRTKRRAERFQSQDTRNRHRVLGSLGRCEVHEHNNWTSRRHADEARRRYHPGDSGLTVFPCTVNPAFWHIGHPDGRVKRGTATRSEVYGSTRIIRVIARVEHVDTFGVMATLTIGAWSQSETVLVPVSDILGPDGDPEGLVGRRLYVDINIRAQREGDLMLRRFELIP